MQIKYIKTPSAMIPTIERKLMKLLNSPKFIVNMVKNGAKINANNRNIRNTFDSLWNSFVFNRYACINKTTDGIITKDPKPKKVSARVAGDSK